MKPQTGSWPQWITAGLALATAILVGVSLYVRSGLASVQDVRDASAERNQLDRRVLVLEKSAEVLPKLVDAVERQNDVVKAQTTEVAVLRTQVENLTRIVRTQAKRGGE